MKKVVATNLKVSLTSEVFRAAYSKVTAKSTHFFFFTNITYETFSLASNLSSDAGGVVVFMFTCLDSLEGFCCLDINAQRDKGNIQHDCG